MNCTVPSRLWALAFAALVVVVSACGSPAPAPLAYDPAPGPDTFGQRCSRTEDCASSLCVQVDQAGGVCTKACTTDADCPAASNWRCLQPDDLSHPICACRANSEPEACGSDVDNNCDGHVDVCQTCSGVEVSLSDPAHCGSCTLACGPQQTCNGTACVCPAGKTVACGASCVDTTTDANNCGACGKACPLGTACVGGACICGDASQPNLCGSTCTSTARDPLNCGACGNRCPASQTCTSGACVCPTASPDNCAGVCVDERADGANCGACGHACSGGQSCVAGACTCPTASPDTCAGKCIDETTNASNCGACGNACVTTSQYCSAGVCTCFESGFTACSTGCVDAQSDPSNCGACGTICGDGQSCIGGACACPGGVTCNGVCEVADDVDHCGSCTTACPQSQLCRSAACTCSGTGLTTCGSACVDTTRDAANCGGCGAACPATQVCTGGACACPAGQTWCGGTCVDTHYSNANCGACGNVCPGAQQCQYGVCGCPTYGQTYCPSTKTCVDATSDAANCGGCGNVCPAAEQCQYSACACPTYGQTYCPSTKTCVDATSDAANCGGCGNVCPAVASCVGGACACPQAGITLCGTACVDTQTDASNCGACGNPCGGALVCSSGACRCPAPTAGTPVRLTSTAGDTAAHPAIAWSGTQAAVLYDSTTTAGATNVLLAILNADGTRAVAKDTVLTSITSASGSAVAGNVVWTGAAWAAVWMQGTTMYGGDDVMFQKFAANGAPQGSPVDITALTPGTPPVRPWWPRLAYSATQGFVLVTTAYEGPAAYFQLLGADGVHPQVALQVATNNNTLPCAVAPSPEGGWEVLALSQNDLDFQTINADGSKTLSPAVVESDATTDTTFPSLSSFLSLANDGTTWDGAWTDGFFTTQGNAIVLTRGPSLGTRLVVEEVTFNSYPGPPPFGAAAVTAGGGTVTIAYESAVDGTSGVGAARMARYRAPSDPNAALVPLTDPTALVTTSTVQSQSIALTSSGATSAMAAWVDSRWGHGEIYAEAVDFHGCQ